MAPARTSPASTSSSASRSRSDAGAGAATTLFPGAVVASLCLHAGLIGVAIAIGALSARDGGERRTLVAAIEPPAPDVPALEAEPLEPDDQELDELLVDPLDWPLEPLPEFEDEEVAEEPDDEALESPTDDAASDRWLDELARPPVERFARLPSQPLGGRPPVEPAPAPEPPPPPAPEPVPAEPTGLDDAPPQLLASPAPNYPSIARRRGWEGSVVLVMQLDSEGRVVDARIETSSGHAVLDEAARAQVLRAWRYVAGPAGRSARHRITFSLQGSN